MGVILSFGEILWDVFPDYKMPGGSPANVAYHAEALGNNVRFISRVGSDPEGRELIRFLKQKGISTKFVQKDSIHPTGLVTVQFDGEEPSYHIHEPSAWDYIEPSDQLINQISELDAICFASLAQRNSVSRKTLHALLESAPSLCKKVFDLNLRPPFINKKAILSSIEYADIIKMNADEYEQISEWFETADLSAALLEKDPNKVIVVTLGAGGSIMYSGNGEFKAGAYPVSGKGDFVGVGDAFLACFTHLVLKNQSGKQLLDNANKYAAYVASQKGAMPDVPPEITDQINNRSD